MDLISIAEDIMLSFPMEFKENNFNANLSLTNNIATEKKHIH